jgi:hypothetical protein
MPLFSISFFIKSVFEISIVDKSDTLIPAALLLIAKF